MPRPFTETTVTAHRAASPAGTLPAQVIWPAQRSGLAPLIALHGI